MAAAFVAACSGVDYRAVFAFSEDLTATHDGEAIRSGWEYSGTISTDRSEPGDVVVTFAHDDETYRLEAGRFFCELDDADSVYEAFDVSFEVDGFFVATHRECKRGSELESQDSP